MDVAISKESEVLNKGLSFLATVGSTAPFIGLFGSLPGETIVKLAGRMVREEFPAGTAIIVEGDLWGVIVAWVRQGRLAEDAEARLTDVTELVADPRFDTHEKLMETRMRTADRLIAAGTLAAGVAHTTSFEVAESPGCRCLGGTGVGACLDCHGMAAQLQFGGDVRLF